MVLINPSPAAVGRPVSGRYGWANKPDGNFVNGAGLSASPFHNDGWPVVTRTRS